MVVGFFLVRQIPLLAHEAHINTEYGIVSEVTPVVDLEDSALLHHETDSHTPLLSPVTDDPSSLTNDEHHGIVHAGTTLELSPTRSASPSLGSHRRSRGVAHRPSFGSAVRVPDMLPNISGRQLWMSSDFWLLFTIMSLCELLGWKAAEFS